MTGAIYIGHIMSYIVTILYTSLNSATAADVIERVQRREQHIDRVRFII